jgi:hypothetical protein
VTGNAPKFHGDWLMIELAYGHALNDEVRQVMADIVDRYLELERLESAAQPLDDVVGWAAALECQARDLQKSLAAANGKDGRERLLDAVKIAAPAGHFFHGTVEHMQSWLLWLAHHIRTEIAGFQEDSAVGGFKDGAAWDEMIRSLIAELNARGLPTGVSKGVRATRKRHLSSG